MVGIPSVHTNGAERPPSRAAAASTTDGFSHTDTGWLVASAGLGRPLADRVPDADRSRGHDLGVHATQAKLAADWRVDERQRLLTEPLGELLAAAVGLVADLDDRRAKREARTGREIGLAQVEVHVQLITRELPPLIPPGHQGGDAAVHQGELHVGMGRAVARQVARPDPPGVPHQALGPVEPRFGQDLAGVLGGAPDDEVDPPVVWR